MKSKMTDDELSELAEALEDACDEWIRVGGIIAPRERGSTYQCDCPMGQLLSQDGRHPVASRIAKGLGLPFSVARGFTAGFDLNCYGGYAPGCDERAVALGVRFRDKYAPEFR